MLSQSATVDAAKSRYILKFGKYELENVRVSKTLHKHFSKCIKDLKYFLKDLHFRSSQQRYCVRKSVLRNFAKFTGKRLC